MLVYHKADYKTIRSMKELLAKVLALWDRYCLPPGQATESRNPREFAWVARKMHLEPSMRPVRLWENFMQWYVGRAQRRLALAVTSKGALILTIDAVHVGDRVFFCQGSDWPFILREQAADEWRFLGKAFLHEYADTAHCVFEPPDARKIREYRGV